MNRSTFAALPFVLIAVGLSSVGCTKTVAMKLARHEVGGPAVAQPAPAAGIYKVKWTSSASRKLQTLRGTECLIGAGEPVGFERGEDGRLVALAGRERIPLDARLPSDARYCVWYERHERQTQFGKEVDK